MTDTDYVALRLGELTQAVIDMHMEAVSRWGKAQAENVIASAEYAMGNAIPSEDYVRRETGLTISIEDMKFIERVVKAKQFVADAISLLRGEVL